MSSSGVVVGVPGTWCAAWDGVCALPLFHCVIIAVFDYLIPIFIYSVKKVEALLTLNIPSLARQRCLPSWGPRRTPWFFSVVISPLFDAVDYSNYFFGGFLKI